jgi:MFS family permease
MPADFTLLKSKNFTSFMGFRTTMVLSFQIVGTIAHWQVYATTRESIYIGYLALTEVIPAISLSLLGGYWADSFNRRRIALIGSTVTLVSILVLLIWASETELKSILPLFVAVAIIGVGRGIIAPASSALLGEIVSKEYFGRAAVFNSIGWHMALITGPAMAGLLYENFSPLVCYQLALALNVTSILSLMLIHAPNKPLNKRENLYVSIREGLRFVFRTKIILGAITLDMFAVLFGGAVALLPAFSDLIYLTGASGLGYLRAAPAVGAAFMGILLIFIPIRAHAGKILLVAVAAFGVTMIAFGLNKDFNTALIILALSGLVDNISVVTRSTILQTHTPDAMRGRVSAVNSIFIASSNEIGAFESGVTAKFMGLVPAVVFGGSMTVIVVIAVAVLIPKLRQLSFAHDQK